MAKKIFIVDDDPDIAFFLKKRLVREGLEVALFQNGASAVAAALSDPPGLIFLDVLMPIMDGYEVCRRIKGNPKTAKIPILFLTAMSSTVSREEAIQAGGDGYLIKPVDLKRLVELSHQFLGNFSSS